MKLSIVIVIRHCVSVCAPGHGQAGVRRQTGHRFGVGSLALPAGYPALQQSLQQTGAPFLEA